MPKIPVCEIVLLFTSAGRPRISSNFFLEPQKVCIGHSSIYTFTDPHKAFWGTCRTKDGHRQTGLAMPAGFLKGCANFISTTENERVGVASTAFQLKPRVLNVFIFFSAELKMVSCLDLHFSKSETEHLFLCLLAF